MDENFLKEQIGQMMEIQKIAYNCGFEDGKKIGNKEVWRVGYQNGYNSKEQELKDQKDKEVEAMYQDSLKAEEIMENTDTLEEKAERLEDEEFARRADLDAEAERQR